MKDNVLRLHKHYSENGLTKFKENLEAKYPELKVEDASKAKTEEKPKTEKNKKSK